MFGQIKKILGIEGVKIDVEVHQPVDLKSNRLNGIIKLTTMTESVVESIAVKVIEKYTRGRGSSKLINDYVLGYIELDEKIYMKKNDVADIPFEMNLLSNTSEMDEMQKQNFLSGGIIALAKKFKGVKSEYRIEAEAIVVGTKLNPIVSKEIVMN